jgi:uncharacterized protein YbjQ (UPF0145 family)
VRAIQWFLVTVTLTWDTAEVSLDRGDLTAVRDLPDRILDLLLDHEDMAGARVSHAMQSGSASVYYRIDVYAESDSEARERAIVPALDVARALGGTAAIMDVQTMSEVELDEYQRTIRYPYAAARPDRVRNDGPRDSC